MICWSFFVEQQMKCFYSYTKLGVSLEIKGNINIWNITRLVKKEMKGDEKCHEVEEESKKGYKLGGSSYVTLGSLVKQLKRVPID